MNHFPGDNPDTVRDEQPASAEPKPAGAVGAGRKKKKRSRPAYREWEIVATGWPHRSFRGPYISADIIVPEEEGGGRQHCLVGSRGPHAEEILSMYPGDNRTIRAWVEMNDYFDRRGHLVDGLWLCLD